MTRKSKNPARAAMERALKAHSDINLLYGVIALLEGGTISTESDSAAQRIMKICQMQSAKRLRDYDHAMEQMQL